LERIKAGSFLRFDLTLTFSYQGAGKILIIPQNYRVIVINYNKQKLCDEINGKKVQLKSELDKESFCSDNNNILS